MYHRGVIKTWENPFLVRFTGLLLMIKQVIPSHKNLLATETTAETSIVRLWPNATKKCIRKPEWDPVFQV